MSTEIIPSIELTGLESTLATMDGYEVKLASLKSRAKTLDVTDRSTYEAAANILGEVKGFDKVAVGAMAPYKQIVARVKDFLQSRELRVKNKVEELRGLLNAKMGDYVRKEEKERKAEEERVARETREKLAREAEEKRKADEVLATERRKERVAQIRTMLKRGEITKRQSEKLLREAGATEEADKARAAAEAEEGQKKAAEVASTVKVESNVKAAAGAVRRVNYKAECTNREAFLTAMCAEYVANGKLGPLAQYVVVSDQKLSEKARELKDVAKIEAICPGAVKASEDRTF